MRCTAKAKHRQERCRRTTVPGMDVCRYHGGLTPRGPASPQVRTGKYAKFLPARMVARYEASLHDPELTSLRRELALTDARLLDLLAHVDTGESRALWQALQDAYQAFKIAQRGGDVAKMRTTVAEVETCIEQGGRDAEAWQEIQSLIESRRKLALYQQSRH
jgi:hypothetical protein